MGNPKLMSNVMAKVSIPIPPIAIQTRIVEILDHFTNLTANLNAELNLRRKQFEHYREKLLAFGEDVECIKYKDVGKWTSGSTPSMDNAEFWSDGSIPWITSKDMKSPIITDSSIHVAQKAIDKKSIKLLPKNVVAFVTRSGILKHTLPIAFIPIETTINQDIRAVCLNEKTLPKFFFYSFLASAKVILNTTRKIGGSVDSLEVPKVMNYQFARPSIETQQSIVEILDKFTALIANIEQEIALRQKQYEYYREELLRFERSTF